METTLRPILFAIGIGLLFFPGIFLLIRKTTPANKLLGISFVVIGFNLFISYLNQTGLMLEYSYFFRSASPTHYLFGPLSYFFIRYLFEPDWRLRRMDWLHFLPFVLHSFEIIPLLSLSAEEKKYWYLQYLNGPLESNPLGVLSFREHTILKSLHILTYQVLIFFLLRPYFGKWRQYLAFGHRNLFLLVSCDFVIKSFAYLAILVLFLFNHIFSNKAHWYIDMLYSLSYISCALFVLANPSVIQEAVTLEGGKVQDVEQIQQKSAEPEFFEEDDTPEDFETGNEKFKELITQLETVMESRQLYLSERMNLQTLADELGVKTYRPSKAIKEWYGLSYSDYINRYRLQYIEEKVKTDERWKSYSIESMAFQAGFGSRAAFYLAFRKVYEGSPVDFFGLKQGHESS